MDNTNGSLNFAIGLDNTQLQTDAARASAQLRSIGNTATAEGARLENSFSRGLALIGGTAAFTMLGKQILDTTAKFEKFGIVLKNTLGDIQGGAALDMIANFAATTPFQLDEVTGAFIKLANQGFVPTRDQMVKLGDLASSTGKSFDQLGEALLDAQTGQFERLKEFGIKASANGDKVTFSFKEQQTTVENTNSAIQAYILSLGTLHGVQGANALISASLTGQLSNLQDKLAAMYNQIGSDNKGILYAAVGGVTSLVDNYETLGKVVLGLVAIYGTYKAAIIIQNTVEKAAVLIKLESALAGQTLTVSQGLQALAAKEASRAQLALNSSMLANPYVQVGMLLLALGYGIYKVATYMTDAEKAQKKLNEAVGESNKEIEAESLQIDTMFSRLKAAKEGSEEYGAAKAAIFAKYGEQLNMLGDENTALKNIALAYDTITEAAQKSARARAMTKITTDASTLAAETTGEARAQIDQLLKKKFGDQKAADGKTTLAGDYFAKISLVVDGKAEATKEIGDLINSFNERIYAGAVGTAGTVGGSVTDNPLQNQLDKIARVKAAFNQTISDAAVKFGESTATNTAKIFDPAKLSLQELMTELPKAAAQLNTLNKSESKDLTAITNQEAKVKGIKTEISEREKQLSIINEVEAQLKKLQDQQKGYGKNDPEYKAIETRLNDLRAKLPDTSKKEISQIEQVKKAMETATGAELDLLAQKLVALEAIRKKQEELRSAAMGKAYAANRDMDNEDLTMMIGDPAKQMNAKTAPIISKKTSDTLKIIGLEFDKLKGRIKENTKEADLLNKELESEEKLKAFEKIVSLTSQISGELSGIVSKNAEKLGLDEKQQEIIQTGLKAFDQIAKGDIIGFVGTIVSTALDSILAVPEKLSERFVSLNEQIQRMLGSLKIANEALNNIGLGTNKNTLNLVQSQIISVTKAASDLSKSISTANYNGANQIISTSYASARVQVEALETSVKSLSNSLLGQGLSDDQRTAIEAVLQSYNELQSTLKTMIQDLTGTSVQGLSDSLAEMFWNGQTAAEAWGQTVDDIIKKVIINQMTTSLLTKPIQAAIDQLVKDSQSGDWVQTPNATGRGGSLMETNMGLSLAEANKFKESISNISAQYAPAFEAARKSLEEAGLTNDSIRTASTKGLAGMNQDTANELNGRFTAIQGHTLQISDTLKILQANSSQTLRHLAGIETNTARLQAIEGSMDSVKNDIGSVKNDISSINLKGIILRK